MREYGQIQTSFWTHPKIVPLPSEAKLLATYLLTGPHSNGLGCYRLPFGYVMADLGWDKATVSKQFRYLIDSMFCLRCDATEWVLIPDYLEWNSIANPKVASARVKEARDCPKTASVWSAMVSAMDRYGRKHLPTDFKRLLDEEWVPISSTIPHKNKKFVFDRDDNACTECGAKEDLTIDHIRPVIYGGTHDVTNLRVLCRSCNSKWFPNRIETVSKQEPTLPNPEPERKETLLVADSDESHDEQKREKWTNEDADVAKTILREVQRVSPSQRGSAKWPDTIRLMRERDGRTHDEILAMFRWANADSFWRANILSPDKLREKWPQLEAKRNNVKPGKPSAHGDFNKLDYSAGIDADGRF